MRKYQYQRDEAESVSGRGCDRCFKALSYGLKHHVADYDRAGERCRQAHVAKGRRSDFLGVADESQLPEWARERTAEIRNRLNNGPAEAEDASMGQTM